jgi:hypothetical protein
MTGAISALVSCLTGGAAVPVLIAAIGTLIGGAMVAKAIYDTAMELAHIIVDLLQGTDCPDKLHYRIGYLIGSFIGEIAGGQIAKGFKFCFVAGTLVHTKDGLKKIEDVKEGDEVLSYNEQTGQNEYQLVLHTFINSVAESLKIKVEGEQDEIGVSYGHPFYVKIRNSEESDEKGLWLNSEDLQVGDLVRLASGKWAKVEAISEQQESIKVYNFEVANNHNYFVGNQGLLVHNAGLYDRCKFRKNSISDAKNGAPRNSNGDITCPTCNEVIPDTITNQTVNGPVTRRGGDLDHYPDTWAERVTNMKQQNVPPTRKEVLNEFNERLRYQCPTCNQGHQFEGIP